MVKRADPHRLAPSAWGERPARDSRRAAPGAAAGTLLRELRMRDEELRAARAEIEAVQERYTDLYDFTPVGYLTLDISGRILKINLTGAAMLGMARDDIIGRNFAQCGGREFLPRMREALQSGSNVATELQIQRPDGSVCDVLLESLATRGTRRHPGVFNAILIDLTERKAMEGKLQAMSFELAMAEERERRKLAQDLHDDLGQLVAVVGIKLSTLIRDAGDGARAQALREIAELLVRANKLIHSLAFQLSPPVLDDLGLVPAMHWLAGEMQALYGLEVRIHDDGLPKSLDRRGNAILFRAVRELLINVARHANVARAELGMRHASNDLLVEVSDAGRGFDPEAMAKALYSSGFGLLSIQERMDQLGGTMMVAAKPGHGTSVTLTLPLSGQRGDGRENAA